MVPEIKIWHITKNPSAKAEGFFIVALLLEMRPA